MLAVVNLDPHQPREATVWLDMPQLGMDYQAQFTMSEQRYRTRREEADRLLGRLDTFLREAKWI